VLAIALTAIALTARPRSKSFRTALGAVSVLIIVFTAAQTLNYSLGLLDAIVYFLGGLLLSIESLEAEAPSEQDTHLPRTIRI
jgi:type IV secretory pathway VirB2 component (pilin)